MGRRIDLDILHRAVVDAVDAGPAPSSDFDLDPKVLPAPGRRLRPAAVLIPVLGAEVVLT